MSSEPISSEFISSEFISSHDYSIDSFDWGGRPGERVVFVRALEDCSIFYPKKIDRTVFF